MDPAAAPTTNSDEALAREAALREVLEAISALREDEAPVFETILRKAVEFCGAHVAGLNLIDETGEWLVGAATFGHTGERWIGGYRLSMDDPDILLVQCVREGRTMQVPDLADTAGYRDRSNLTRVSAVDEEGIRTWLGVPLTQDGRAIGCFGLTRTEVRPFDRKQISLIETFAAQAVIAIESARRFRELQARLEREAASREVLDAISRSRDDEQPVFDVILENATRLCHAHSARLHMMDEEATEHWMVATCGGALDLFEPGKRFPLSSPLVLARAMREARTIKIDDISDDELYRQRNPLRVRMVEEEGVRSFLAVPLLKGARSIGCLALHRKDVTPFVHDEIALIETFAAQAVIAIENVRQFRALETLNAELGERVKAQVGEIERMGRLKRFLSPAVAQAITSTGAEAKLSSHRALVAVLFADMRGFTAFCETAEPEETIEVLQTYHEQMGALISEHGAGVDHRSGDGIMAIFNDPLPCDEPALRAVELALAMRERMEKLCKDWRQLGHRLGFGVGISLGYATVGMVGSTDRYDYTASGTVVNLAARLCDHADDGEILLSPRAYRATRERFRAEAAGELVLKGIQAPVDVFRVVGAQATADGAGR